MKHLMSTTVTIGVILICVFLFSSCQNDERVDLPDQSESGLLTINSITGLGETRAKDAFANGDKIAINITGGSFDALYTPDQAVNAATYRNRVLTNTSGTWKLDKNVFLNSTKASVYAHYPVSTKPELETASQTDYLVGKPKETNVSSASPSVNIVMQHAMTLFKFKLKKEAYSGSGVVKSIEIGNAASKNLIMTAGEWNFDTNKVVHKTGSAGIVKRESSSGLLTLSTAFQTTPIEILTLPTLTATTNDGDIYIKVTIDDRVFTWNVPKSTEFKSGTVYNYEVTVNSVGLQMGTVTITPWATGTTQALTGN